jgi:hypothetical protein
MNETARAQQRGAIERALVDQMEASLRSVHQMRAELPGDLRVALDLSVLEGAFEIASGVMQPTVQAAYFMRG